LAWKSAPRQPDADGHRAIRRVWAGKQRMAILEKVLATKSDKVAEAVEGCLPSKAE